MKNKLMGLLLGGVIICSLPVSAITVAEQRAAFLQAENLLQKHDDAGFLAQLQQLKDYPLYPYLQAQWLKNNLTKEAEIEQFLTNYKDSRYADSLRRDWLATLAKTQQWNRFAQSYVPESDSAQVPALQCHFQWAQYNLGKKEVALTAAKNLWATLKTQPTECNDLFTALRHSNYFSEELLWQRFANSLRGKKPSTALAVSLKNFMTDPQQQIANHWLTVHDNPALISQTDWLANNPKAGEIFAHAIDRLTAKQLSAAISLWDTQKSRFKLNPATADYVEQRLGLALAHAGNSAEAFLHLNKASVLDEEARHWLVRTALREQNWQGVLQGVEKLTPREKADDKWRYWQARALAENGKSSDAQAIYAELAQKSGFYGFLAADKLKLAYQFKDIPVPVTEEEVETLKQKEAFKIAAEWFALNRGTEATRQWWYTIKKSDSKQIMAAAKLAQQWQMPKLAAFTLAKADYWTDLAVRFPIVYLEHINEQAVKQAIDPAIVLGLIRQESVFDELAGSAVGARGLMQIMPATGKQIANALKERWQSASSLYNPVVNVKYGTYYYKQLLDKFNGQVALAAAGYNAGPNRVKNWLPNKPMAMDIWIETIPFNETRQYVALVLANALFYQQRMNRNVLKLDDFMSEVPPR